MDYLRRRFQGELPADPPSDSHETGSIDRLQMENPNLDDRAVPGDEPLRGGDRAAGDELRRYGCAGVCTRKCLVV